MAIKILGRSSTRYLFRIDRGVSPIHSPRNSRFFFQPITIFRFTNSKLDTLDFSANLREASPTTIYRNTRFLKLRRLIYTRAGTSGRFNGKFFRIDRNPGEIVNGDQAGLYAYRPGVGTSTVVNCIIAHCLRAAIKY